MTWQPYGGGGNTFSLSDVLAMPFDKAVWMQKELGRHRDAEAANIEKAIAARQGNKT